MPLIDRPLSTIHQAPIHTYTLRVYMISNKGDLDLCDTNLRGEERGRNEDMVVGGVIALLLPPCGHQGNSGGVPRIAVRSHPLRIPFHYTVYILRCQWNKDIKLRYKHFSRRDLLIKTSNSMD